MFQNKLNFTLERIEEYLNGTLNRFEHFWLKENTEIEDIKVYYDHNRIKLINIKESAKSLQFLLNLEEIREIFLIYKLSELAYCSVSQIMNLSVVKYHKCLFKRKLAYKILLAAKADLNGVVYNFNNLQIKKERPNVKKKGVFRINTRRGGVKQRNRRNKQNKLKMHK